MNQLSRSGRLVGALMGMSLFVFSPLIAVAFWSGFPFGGGSVKAGPVELCPKTITAAGISVLVLVPCHGTPPPPVDVCPNVPGTQTSTPCADELCENEGGIWDGDSCEEPPPPVDVCPNVPGEQNAGPCADEECEESGGTWNGESCDLPPPPPADVCPNVPGEQEEGPCADELCENEGGIWDGDSCEEPPGTVAAFLISEVHYDLGEGQGTETANEWVELYNGTGNAINLGNYTIGDAVSDDELPEVMLPAGAYAVVIASSTTPSFWSIPAEAVVVQIPTVTIGNGLTNGGDMVYLFDKVASTTVDAVSWGSNTSAFTPSVPVVAAGHSMARAEVVIDTDTAADWIEQEIPDPGQ